MKQYHVPMWPTFFIILSTFFIDIFMSVIMYQHVIHASYITFCLVLWLHAPLSLRVMSGFSTVFSYLFDGRCCSLELLGIFIPIIVIYGLHSVLNEADWVKVFMIFVMLKLKLFFTGTALPWTHLGIIANIVIIVVLLKYMRDRRAIA